jgi:hypothetical protein
MMVSLFCSGTHEDFIKAVVEIDYVGKGQVLKEAKEKYLIACGNFMGKALTAFNNAARSDKGQKPFMNFELDVKTLAATVVFLRSYSIHVKAMLRLIQKPHDVNIRDFLDCQLQVNVENVLPEDDISDILAYDIPNTWLKKNVKLSFDTQARNQNAFIEICEFLAYGESTNYDPMAKANQDAGEKGATWQWDSSCKCSSKPPKVDQNGSKYCPLNTTNGHDGKECKFLFRSS